MFFFFSCEKERNSCEFLSSRGRHEEERVFFIKIFTHLLAFSFVAVYNENSVILPKRILYMIRSVIVGCACLYEILMAEFNADAVVMIEAAERSNDCRKVGKAL